MVGRLLADFLKAHHRLYLDTAVFIYFVERNPRYFDFCDEIFRRVEEGRIEAMTSTLTMTEILVQPYKMKKDELVLKFYSLFSTYPHLKWIDLTLGISDLAAKVRAERHMKTPDAIHGASALFSGATGLVCNDRIFRRVEGMECLMLDEVVPVKDQ